MEIPWETVGPIGAVAIIIVALFIGLLKVMVRIMVRRNGAEGGTNCPHPKCDGHEDHVRVLARHEEAIETLKRGQSEIFRRLNELPGEIAKLLHSNE